MSSPSFSSSSITSTRSSGQPENDLYLGAGRRDGPPSRERGVTSTKSPRSSSILSALPASPDPVPARDWQRLSRLRAGPARRQPHRFRPSAELRLRPARGPRAPRTLCPDLRYVLVDEYQDTNYVQEQLLLKLTEKTRNLCVVGDEDQSLYRFRGATVRNILEFPQRLPGCAIVKLTTNYRSHRAIVERYDRWMASADWSNPRGAPFRYDKTIEADRGGEHPDYPSVFGIWGQR